MSNESKNMLPIQSIEIKIDSDSNIPHIILNGIDLKNERIGLKSLKIIWGSRKDEIPETLIHIDYLNGTDKLQEVSIQQSFPNTLLRK